MDFTLNFFAEFKDRNLEAKFFDETAKKSLKYLRFGVLISGGLFFFSFFYDYLFLDAGGLINLITYSLIPRTVILLFALVLYFLSKKSENYRLILNLMSVFVLLTFASHLFMAPHFIDLDLTFEALDVVLVMLGIFFIPNRWLYNLVFSIITVALFVVVSPFIIKGLTYVTIIELLFYFFWFVFIIGILLLRTNDYKRAQYANGLELERLVLTDSLTNASNRIAFDTTINKLCEEKKSFCVILFDIDDFKKINDTYGHIIGDEVLKNLVKTVSRNIRGGDTLARWGGEEFVILLIEKNLETAVKTAERLRGVIASTELENIDYNITASFGVTEYIDGDNLNTIMSRADKLLYTAKNQGKNKVCSDSSLNLVNN